MKYRQFHQAEDKTQLMVEKKSLFEKINQNEGIEEDSLEIPITEDFHIDLLKSMYISSVLKYIAIQNWYDEETYQKLLAYFRPNESSRNDELITVLMDYDPSQKFVKLKKIVFSLFYANLTS